MVWSFFRRVVPAALIIALAAAGPASAKRLAWMDTHRSPAARAKAFVAALTLEEERAIMRGIAEDPGSGSTGPPPGAAPPIPRVAFPGLHATDGPLGVRQHA